MRRTMMKSKIHRARVTGADLNYVGSISLDPALMELADILEWEKVAVLDIDNGARFETYAIVGGPGEVTLNGAAARLVQPGDRVIVITYADYEAAELEGFAPTIVHVDDRNRPVPDPTVTGPERPSARARGCPPDSTGRADLTDVLVLGSGVAGLTAARTAAEAGLTVAILTKGELAASATRYAQGGVAAALSPGRLAGPALLRHAVGRRRAVRPRGGPGPRGEGPARLRELMALGAQFDRTGDGGPAAPLAMAREGGHSLARVVHAGGDATGHEVERALVAATAGHPGGHRVRGVAGARPHVEHGRVAGRVGGAAGRRPRSSSGRGTSSSPAAAPDSCTP